jgi:DNA-directed RNA polymerase specialized sigma24 family protein
MGLEWNEWDEIMLELDVQQALSELSEAEQHFVSLLLEKGSLGKVARELGLKLSEAQRRWESISQHLRERLRGYGGGS